MSYRTRSTLSYYASNVAKCIKAAHRAGLTIERMQCKRDGSVVIHVSNVGQPGTGRIERTVASARQHVKYKDAASGRVVQTAV